MRLLPRLSWLSPFALILALVPPAHGDEPNGKPLPLAQRGRSIVVCGQKVDIGTPVILWSDPGGHNAYLPAPKAAGESQAERKAASPGFGFRKAGVDPGVVAEAEKNGWTLPTLQQAIDQFVIHYDVCGTSDACFRVLHERNLSVQFMLDLDGTIYQTLDLKEAAYHATKANGRSVGIEIANMGAYPPEEVGQSPLDKWYGKDGAGQTRINLPPRASVPTLAAGSDPLRPARPEPITGVVQGKTYTQYDLTPQQYEALAKLTAGLCATFPKLKRDVPRDAQGGVIDHKIDDAAYKTFGGILGHYHVQANKQDPGPAFQWDRIVGKSPAPTPAK